MPEENQIKQARHIVNVSGGKDSTALAVYMRDRLPDAEYVFCDTGKELQETYDYLYKIEEYLGKEIVRLKPDAGFDHYWKVYGKFLPSARVRWCTRMLKLKPFEKYVGDDPCYSYIAIRADENREGYISTKENITPVFPFKEDGIKKADVIKILDECGLGLPEYYEWRSRSGCFFCFFQQNIEWVGLKERHPELFEQAKAYETADAKTGTLFTWNSDRSLVQLADQAEEIKNRHQAQLDRMKAQEKDKTLFDIFHDVNEDEQDERACLICDL